MSDKTCGGQLLGAPVGGSALNPYRQWNQLAQQAAPVSLLQELRNRLHKTSMLIDANESELRRLFATRDELSKAIAALDLNETPAQVRNDSPGNLGIGDRVEQNNLEDSDVLFEDQPSSVTVGGTHLTAPDWPEGFIPWSGGECPVPPDTEVEVLWHDGSRLRFWAGPEIYPRGWLHSKGFDHIIAYRIIESGERLHAAVGELNAPTGWDKSFGEPSTDQVRTTESELGGGVFQKAHEEEPA